MSWRSRAKQEDVCEGSVARSGCSRQAWLCHPGTRGAVSTDPSLGPVWGWGAFTALSCFPAASWIFCVVGAAAPELRCWPSPPLLCRCPQQSPAAVVSCFGSAEAGTHQSGFPAPLTPQGSGSPSRRTLPSCASNEQQCDGKHWWLPRTPWGGQAEAGWGLQGVWGNSLSLLTALLCPALCQALTLLCMATSQHGGADGTRSRHLQLYWVLLVLLGAQPSCRTPVSQPCFWSPVQIPVWLLAPSHGDRV